MSLHYQFNFDEDMLTVTTVGRDDGLTEALDYSKSVIQQLRANNCTKILCDERGVEYSLNASETFNLAQITAEEVTETIRVAIVCSPEFLSEGLFWENVAVNRGLIVKMFTDIVLAKAWLTK